MEFKLIKKLKIVIPHYLIIKKETKDYLELKNISKKIQMHNMTLYQIVVVKKLRNIFFKKIIVMKVFLMKMAIKKIL